MKKRSFFVFIVALFFVGAAAASRAWRWFDGPPASPAVTNPHDLAGIPDGERSDVLAIYGGQLDPPYISETDLRPAAEPSWLSRLELPLGAFERLEPRKRWAIEGAVALIATACLIV